MEADVALLQEASATVPTDVASTVRSGDQDWRTSAIQSKHFRSSLPRG